MPARDHLSGDDMLCLPREHLEAFTTALAEGRAGDARALTCRCAESPGPAIRSLTLDDLAAARPPVPSPGTR